MVGRWLRARGRIEVGGYAQWALSTISGKAGQKGIAEQIKELGRGAAPHIRGKRRIKDATWKQSRYDH